MGNTISDNVNAVKQYVGLEVLTMKDAYDQMAINETEDKYLKGCMESEANSIAIRNEHMMPCDPFTREQALAMSTTALAAVPESLKPTNTIKIAFFEKGLPHTRPPATIWFPESALRANKMQFNETFLHECIHLHQREHEDRWRKFYEDAWDFKPWQGKIPKDIERRRRLNPDTIRQPFYIWRNKWVPIAVYSKPDAANLREVRLIFLRPSTEGNSGWDSVCPEGWLEFFGTQEPSICEHPHEMAAYFLSDNENPFDSEAARLLRKKFLMSNLQ